MSYAGWQMGQSQMPEGMAFRGGVRQVMCATFTQASQQTRMGGSSSVAHIMHSLLYCAHTQHIHRRKQQAGECMERWHLDGMGKRDWARMRPQGHAGGGRGVGMGSSRRNAARRCIKRSAKPRIMIDCQQPFAVSPGGGGGGMEGGG